MISLSKCILNQSLVGLVVTSAELGREGNGSVVTSAELGREDHSSISCNCDRRGAGTTWCQNW
jgi:hypothetical protein